MSPINLDYQQSQALQLMLAGKNVFVGGKAGTGKSTLLHQFISIEEGKNIALLAPTGVAAQNIGGCTIHRFFGFPGSLITEETICNMGKQQIERLKSTQIFVVDEISMVSSNLFWAMDFALRNATENYHLPWGGKQIICVGDFAQLTPVVTSRKEEQFLLLKYGGCHAFQCSEFQAANLEFVELNIAHRQSADVQFQRVLDIIRCCGGGDYNLLGQALNFINSKCVKTSVMNDGIVLCPRKRDAETINNINLEAMNTERHVFTGSVKGPFSYQMQPTDLELLLKINAKVMLLVNEPMTVHEEQGYVNGDLGSVVGFKNTPDEQWVEVKIARNGRIVCLLPYTWKEIDFDVVHTCDGPKLQQRVIADFTQLPVRVAYASTIHRLQGSTLGRGRLQLGEYPCFAPGMLYVALSRFRKMEDISIDRPLTLQDVIVSPDVVGFYEDMEARFGAGSFSRGCFGFEPNDIYTPFNIINAFSV